MLIVTISIMFAVMLMVILYIMFTVSVMFKALVQNIKSGQERVGTQSILMFMYVGQASRLHRCKRLRVRYE